MAGIPVSACDVFVHIWVDVDAVQSGGTAGIYAVDNRVATGTKGEGTAQLFTCLTRGSNVCWQVFPVSPCDQASVQIQSVANSNAWGPSGQPEMVPGSPNTFTGQVQNAGLAPYELTLTVQLATGSGFTLPLPGLGMNVLAA